MCKRKICPKQHLFQEIKDGLKFDDLSLKSTALINLKLKNKTINKLLLIDFFWNLKKSHQTKHRGKFCSVDKHNYVQC